MIGTLENLFDYERIEDAWIDTLGKSDKCFPTFIDEEKDASAAPYIETQLINVVPIGQYPYRNEILDHMWKGVLVSRVVTFRGINSDKHREMVGRVRLAIQRWRTTFTEAQSPYHSVEGMKETTLTRGVDDTNDWSEIHAEVIFVIREQCWPK